MMPDSVTVIKPGSKCTAGNVSGMISAIEISLIGISYKFNYWDRGEYKFMWLSEYEFNHDHADSVQIGFRTETNS
jgi:hypothetical protein